MTKLEMLKAISRDVAYQSPKQMAWANEYASHNTHGKVYDAYQFYLHHRHLAGYCMRFLTGYPFQTKPSVPTDNVATLTKLALVDGRLRVAKK